MRNLNCHDIHQLLDAFQDNEIDSVTSLQVQEHLNACPDCRAHQWWHDEACSSLDRIGKKTSGPTSALRERIAKIPTVTTNRGWKAPPFVLRAAALVMAAFVLTFFFLPQAGHSGMDARLFVQNHKTLTTGNDGSLEIATSDPNEAAEWLSKHIPEVEAPRHTPAGYRLVGARITELDGRNTGRLLYEGGGRKISCFVRAGDESVDRGFDSVVLREDGIRAGRCHGHQIITWDGTGGSIVVVGDLAEESLLAFAEQNPR